MELISLDYLYLPTSHVLNFLLPPLLEVWLRKDGMVWNLTFEDELLYPLFNYVT